RMWSAAETEIFAEAEHAAVLPEDRAPDLSNATVAGIVDDPLHHDPAKAFPLDRAVDLDGVFGPDIVRVRDDANHAEHLFPRRFAGRYRYERHFPIIVDLSHSCGRLVAQITLRSEEPHADVLRAQSTEHVVDSRLILRPYRA